MALVVELAFFVNENIQFKIFDSPTPLPIAIGSSTSPFMIACVYRTPGAGFIKSLSLRPVLG